MSQFPLRLSRALVRPGEIFLARLTRNIISDLREQQHRLDVRRHIEDISVRAAPQVVGYEFPSEYPQEFRRAHAFPEHLRYLLKDVEVSMRTGVVWLSTGKQCLEESVGSWHRLMGWEAGLAEGVLPARKLKAVSGRVFAVPPRSYFHFVTEVVPRLSEAVTHGVIDTIVISREAPSYVGEAVRSIAPREIPIVLASGRIRVDRLYLAAEYSTGFVLPSDLLGVKAIAEGIGASSSSDAIYVSRRGHARAYTNEHELEAELACMGLTIVDASAISFTDQVKAFASARLITGPHGAGLTNLVWAHTGCTVGEIFREKFNDCFARLGVSSGCDYNHIRLDPSTGALTDAEMIAVTTFVSGLLTRSSEVNPVPRNRDRDDLSASQRGPGSSDG